MKSPVLYFIGLIIFLSFNLGHCFRMKITPGIPKMGKYDPSYVDDIIIKTRRNGRRSEYVLNIEFTLKKYLGNNVTAHYIFYEYLHNEYRPSFVEMHFKLCDVILKDPFIGAISRKAGLTVCPIPPGRYHVMNLTFDQEFPSVWPFEKGMCRFIAKAEPGGREIAVANVTLEFKMIKT